MKDSKKRSLEEESVKQDESIELSDEDVLRKQKKAAKKAVKKLRKEQSELKNTEINAVEDIVEEDVNDNKDKKHKKKKHKNVIENSNEANNNNNNNNNNNKVIEKVHNVKSGKSIKSLYIEHAITKYMSVSDIMEHRSELGIQVFPEEEAMNYKPITSFDCLESSLQLANCKYITSYLKNKNFTKPSPIQSQCWAPLFSGKDVVGIAATGSGKTLGFLIPGLLRIQYLKALNSNHNNSKKNHIPSPKILIVAPTRELAMQSYQVVEDIGGPLGVCIYGGVPKGTQRQALQAGAEIVVATPGRLMDLIEENVMSLAQVCYLVLDEADRMLDEGFEPVIRKLISLCPTVATANDSFEQSLAKRQTVMFSATWPEEIRNLADKFLSSDMIKVTVGSDELSANHRVTQIVECVQAHEKDKKLVGLLEKYHKSRKNRILIFVLYKKEAADLQVKLAGRGYNVTAIHGDKSQVDRTNALEEFKSGRVPLLIATDVAARGLDIPQVEYVINYSFPLTVEDYVHRIGRTGRGGATGISHTFFTDFDKSLAGALVAVLQEANQEIPKDIYQYPLITKKKQSKLYGDFGPKAELAGKKATKITFD